jgi:hypothetical protein
MFDRRSAHPAGAFQAEMLMQRRFAVSMALVIVAAGTVLAAMPAAAQECYVKPIRVKGSVGVMEATAKSRARSAWIKKVRAHRKLGPSYAAWLRAREPRYDCRKAGKGHVCEAAAIPCKVPAVTPAHSLR